MAYTIRVLQLFYFGTLQIFDYSDFYWLCFDRAYVIKNNVLKLRFLVLSRL